MILSLRTAGLPMLSHLKIRDFAIVASLELDFRAGFTVITGETGAGKSILMDALGLCLGDRAEAGLARAGAERAEVSAGFDIRRHAAAQDWLRERELDADDECWLRRTISADGRSRAWINGSPATLADVKALGEAHVECDPRNQSEIAVPVFDPKGKVWAVLDVDSEALSAFDEMDQRWLERLLKVFAEEKPL